MNPWAPGDPIEFLDSGLEHLAADDVLYALWEGHHASTPATDRYGADAVNATGWTPTGDLILVRYREADGDDPYVVWHAAQINPGEKKRYFPRLVRKGMLTL